MSSCAPAAPSYSLQASALALNAWAHTLQR